MTLTAERTATGGAWEYADEAEALLAALSTAAASADSPVIDCRGWDTLEIAVTIAPTGDPVGGLYIQGSKDASSGFGYAAIDKILTDDLTAVTHDPTSDARKVVINDPAAATVVTIKLAGLTSYVRARYVRTGGGNATGITSVSYRLGRRKHGGKS